MESKKKGKDLTSAEEQELFSNLEFSYNKSKNDVWAELNDLVEGEPTAKEEENTKVIRMNWVSMSIAASMVLMLSYGLFARFYTKTIAADAGELASHTLPDGSEVHLNADTKISYAPYWWKFKREVELEGEAFFEVEKGERFSVHSDLGVTEVLGTKFNIYARGLDYEVFCETGKVGVSNKYEDQVVLLPGEYVKLNIQKLEKENAGELQQTIMSWRNNQFNYNTTPFSKVFDDIERHYGVTIKLLDESIANETQTSAMTRPKTVEGALKLMGWPYEKIGEKTYLIKRK